MLQLITDFGFGFATDQVLKFHSQAADSYNYVFGFRGSNHGELLPEWMGKNLQMVPPEYPTNKTEALWSSHSPRCSSHSGFTLHIRLPIPEDQPLSQEWHPDVYWSHWLDRRGCCHCRLHHGSVDKFRQIWVGAWMNYPSILEHFNNESTSHMD